MQVIRTLQEKAGYENVYLDRPRWLVSDCEYE